MKLVKLNLMWNPTPKQIEFLSIPLDTIFLLYRGQVVGQIKGIKMPKYNISPQQRERLDKTFKYHSPKDDQPERYVIIREKCKELAEVICENTPPSREQSIALTALEEVSMRANQAIAINEAD
jgi:hypothetical protein